MTDENGKRETEKEETPEYDQGFWETRYREHTALWSVHPNPQLAAEITDLPVGTAADIGCGEGADAIELASRGWRVTAVDFAGTALERARQHAAALGPEIADRIEWLEADLATWNPTQPFDLVTAHYVHPTLSRHELLDRLGAAVALGGTLLVVDHHPTDEAPTGLDTHGSQDTHGPQALVTPEQIAAGLDPGHWEIAVAETRPRTATRHDGSEVALSDVVLRARRRP